MPHLPFLSKARLAAAPLIQYILYKWCPPARLLIAYGDPDAGIRSAEPPATEPDRVALSVVLAQLSSDRAYIDVHLQVLYWTRLPFNGRQEQGRGARRSLTPAMAMVVGSCGQLSGY